jgi:hypothetical protein
MTVHLSLTIIPFNINANNPGVRGVRFAINDKCHGLVAECSEHGNAFLSYIKGKEFLQWAEKLLASQDGLCCKVLVMNMPNIFLVLTYPQQYNLYYKNCQQLHQCDTPYHSTDF